MALPPDRGSIAGTPTNAQAKAGFGALWDYVTGLLGLTGDAEQARNALGLGNPMGFKNRLINAQGLINQRVYVSGTATTTANQYTLDRWRVVTSGQNLTFSTSNNEVTFTAPAGGVEQVIEGLNLESGTYTLSWTGTATATVGGTSVANGGQVTVVGGTNTTVRFIGGTFKYPQFEKGSTATSFDYRPYGTELSLCQRYLPCVNASATGDIANGTSTSNTAGTVLYVFKVTPRVPPTGISATNVSNMSMTTATVGAAVNSIAFSNASSDAARLTLGSATSTFTASQPLILYANGGGVTQIQFTGCEL